MKKVWNFSYIPILCHAVLASASNVFSRQGHLRRQSGPKLTVDTGVVKNGATRSSSSSSDYGVYCSCPSCTLKVWNTMSQFDNEDEAYTCGARIKYLEEWHSAIYPTQADACTQVASEFPTECGACDPGACQAAAPAPPTPEPTEQPSPAPTTSPTYLECGCEACSNVWNTLAGSYTCGARIEWKQNNDQITKEGACAFVAAEFPGVCGPCDPSMCEPSLAPSPAPSPLPTQQPLTSTPTTRQQITAAPVANVCGCNACTEEVWNTGAGQGNERYTCGARITWYEANISPNNFATACSTVANEFPPECGPCACLQQPSEAPTFLDGMNTETLTPTFLDTTTAKTLPPSTRQPKNVTCGCNACTDEVLNTNAGPEDARYSCRARITWYEENVSPNDFLAACFAVAGEFPSECGPCACLQPPSPSPTILDGMDQEDGDTRDGPGDPGTDDVVDTDDSFGGETRCGCSDCDVYIWNKVVSDWAGDYTCGQRIEYMMSAEGGSNTEEQACTRIAAVEFPGLCGPRCNPAKCDGRGPQLLPTTDMYCYKPYSERKRFQNVWGNYIVETKEGQYCGPGSNHFSRDTVSIDGNGHLRLQFKKVGGLWTGSEVRVVLPQSQMPFMYGTYAFRVGSITRTHIPTGQVLETALPPSLTLGLFTWDDTETYSVHENWNHEVDIEIARWNVENGADIHLLIQPPEQESWLKVSSRTGNNGQFDQANNLYQFTWNPGKIDWYSTAAGGINHSYEINTSNPDRIQCLPANMEIRMNLWNLLGDATPTLGSGEPTSTMPDDQMVEVVIEDFTYTPSGVTGLAVGSTCTKSCHCEGSLRCIDNVCTDVSI